MCIRDSYVGASFPLSWEDPHHAWIRRAKPALRPSVANTPLGAKQGLCGIIRYVSHVLKERLGSHIPRVARGGGRKPVGRNPLLTADGSEDGYVGQLPGHVAAPLVHGGLNPIVGGASADTRLAEQPLSAEYSAGQTHTDPSHGARVPECQKAETEQENDLVFPTDSR